jgi:quercetin dioxygenase-like cupin family protein
MTARPRINVLLRSEDSGDRVGLTDNGVPAGTAGPPLHRHDFDEAFYVVEGELTFQVGEELVVRRAGEIAFARRGVAHTFANHSGADARVVIVITPAGFERYFDGMAARAAGVEPPPEVAKGWPEVTKVGPQIGDRRPAPVAAEPPAASHPAAPSSFATHTLVRSEESDGAVALVENAVPAGWTGTPLHHHAFDEAFYVLDGELTLQVGEDLVVRRAGELAFAPGGAHHAVANPSAREARYLLVCTPGGFQRYFDRLAAEAAGTEPPPEVAKGYPETVVVGPPIGAEKRQDQGS